ncbi:hypothetical protein RIF29_33633 [Crotalaria pallida]|uniref:MYND-type domain-containing protein n=1 Tax=Crotalaria pallida TaxID=3830 RepID=A0AAN9E8I6_CROPI
MWGLLGRPRTCANHGRWRSGLRRLFLSTYWPNMLQIERKYAYGGVVKKYYIGKEYRMSIFFSGIDAVHGHNSVYKATIFPHNIGLRATRDPELVKRIGAATALEVRATGIQYAYAPCIAVCRDPRWGRYYESYSEDPEVVEAMTEIISGLQGDILDNLTKGVAFIAGNICLKSLMLIYVASSLSSLNLNWFLELLGLAEKKAPISDHSTNINNTWLFLLLIFLAIVIFLVLHFLAEITGYNNNNARDVEVDDESLKEEEQDHLSHELDHYFDGGQQQLIHRTATSRGIIVRTHGACAYCGNPSNTRCSRCKVARYCSVECQIRHWRSGHKHECFETETEADKARPIHGHGPSKIAKKSERAFQVLSEYLQFLDSLSQLSAIQDMSRGVCSLG